MWEQVKQALAQSTARFLTELASLLPGLAALILALLLSLVLGWIVAVVVRHALATLRFDDRMAGCLLSEGIKWLVIVLAVAMALEHLRIAPGIVELAFGILFGGIVFGLALAVGLGSKDLVTKSLGRDVKRASSEEIEDPLRHL